MRILHVITRLILGGAQQNTVMSCKAQADAGHEVHLAFGPIHGPEGSLLEEARASGATLHEIKPMVRELNPINDWRCYRAIRALVRELRPDVVHSHSSKAGIIVRCAAWAEGKRRSEPHVWYDDRERAAALVAGGPSQPIVIHTVHGLPFHERQSRPIHQLYVRLEKHAAQRCHHLIAITPEMVEAFVEKGIAPREKFTVIPSGVDVEAFTPRPERRDAVRMKYGIPADALVVGHVGRLDPLKGHADLLEVLPALNADGRSVWLFFVGDGFHRSELQKHPHMAMGRTVMTGLVGLSSVPGLLSAMDVMALPSYQEGQSRTLCEALLCGIPVVGYDVGGIPSVIRDGQTGRLVPVGDTPMLAKALIDLLVDPGYREALAERGRRHVVEHFSAAKMNRELLELYGLLFNPFSGGTLKPTDAELHE